MTVSSAELERLVKVAREAGALGAKLSGAGRGGNLIALVDGEKMSQAVEKALLDSGARAVLQTILNR
jgi:mevalonate kinase